MTTALGDGKVVLFDLGGVLIENAGPDALRALTGGTLTPEEILHKWLASPSAAQFERGRCSGPEFAEAFIEEWQISLTPAQFLDAFAQWPKRFFNGATELVRTVRARHHVGCLSNTNAVHWRRFPEVETLLDFCFASHLTGFMKPERQAYEDALQKLNIGADQVYFFDDLLPNVQAAKVAGIHAYQVRSFADLKSMLRAAKLHP